MAEIVKEGAKASAANTKKPARNVTPKLKCVVTGHERFTNKEYLAGKAASCGSMKKFLEHYVCSDAMVMLREGKTVDEVRKALKVGEDVSKPSAEVMKIAMEINGKRAKKAKTPAAAKPAGAKATTPKTPKAAKPATPKAAPAPGEKKEESAAATPAANPAAS